MGAKDTGLQYEYLEEVPGPDLDNIRSYNNEVAKLRGDSKKYDAGKPMWDLLQWDAVEEIVKVLTFGAERYGAYSWKEVEGARDRYMAALMRHIKAWYQGEEIDPDSGIHHLGHAGCCLLFLLQGYIEKLPDFIQEEK